MRLLASISCSISVNPKEEEMIERKMRRRMDPMIMRGIKVDQLRLKKGRGGRRRRLGRTEE